MTVPVLAVHLVGIRQDFSICLGWFKPAFVRGGLLSVGIFKGCVQVGPVRSLQLALDFCLELFAQDLQFLCALLPHLLENMDPPLDELAKSGRDPGLTLLDPSLLVWDAVTDCRTKSVSEQGSHFFRGGRVLQWFHPVSQVSHGSP